MMIDFIKNKNYFIILFLSISFGFSLASLLVVMFADLYSLKTNLKVLMSFSILFFAVAYVRLLDSYITFKEKRNGGKIHVEISN